MAKVEWKGGTMLSPLPAVLVTCSDGTRNNVFTVGWTGILNSEPPKTYISVRPSRFSHGLIKKSGEFVINLTTENMARATDYCGVFTGAKVDKFEKCHLTAIPSSKVGCPSLLESPVTLECKVTEIIPLGSHDMFVADIVAVNVDDSLLDESEKLHLGRAKLLAYLHGEYWSLGRRLGKFGFSAKKGRTQTAKKKG